MLEFGNTDTTYRDYRYGIVSDSPADPMNAGFHSMGTDMPMSENAATFTPQTMLSDEFATLSPDMMGNMIAMSNMNMGQIAGDPSISMFPSPSLPNPNPHRMTLLPLAKSLTWISSVRFWRWMMKMMTSSHGESSSIISSRLKKHSGRWMRNCE